MPCGDLPNERWFNHRLHAFESVRADFHHRDLERAKTNQPQISQIATDASIRKMPGKMREAEYCEERVEGRVQMFNPDGSTMAFAGSPIEPN
jgi:hypothetical protein